MAPHIELRTRRSKYFRKKEKIKSSVRKYENYPEYQLDFAFFMANRSIIISVYITICCTEIEVFLTMIKFSFA